MKPTNPTTTEEARQEAIDWQNWQSEQDLSFVELVEWADHFVLIAEKFNLTEEFEENGVI